MNSSHRGERTRREDHYSLAFSRQQWLWRARLLSRIVRWHERPARAEAEGAQPPASLAIKLEERSEGVAFLLLLLLHAFLLHGLIARQVRVVAKNSFGASERLI